MKREIEFRGKTETGEWVYGAYYKQRGFYVDETDIDCIITTTDVLSNDLGLDYEEVIPETVGQYVGVKDINKKKIYEYDRVKCKGVETLGTVLFDGGGFGIEFDEPIAEDWTSTALYCLINEEGFAECEVIGTVFDKESDNETK